MKAIAQENRFTSIMVNELPLFEQWRFTTESKLINSGQHRPELDLELSADPAPLRLSVMLAGGGVMLAWYGRRGSGSSRRSGLLTTWSNSPASITATARTVTVAASDAHQFFRLTNP